MHTLYIYTYSYRDNHLSQKCGPDALLYLVFQRYIIVYLLIVTVISVGIVLPVNYHGNLGRQRSY